MYVLVVDDEPMMRELYSTIFDWEGNGFKLAGVAHDGLKALEIMRKTQVDVVITDIKMPVMSGIELISRAKAEFPRTEFVVMSGYDDYSLVREAFKLGAKDYFLKEEMDPEHIINVLLKITEEAKNTVSQNSVGATLTDEEYRNMLSEKLIKELIWNSQPRKTFKQLEEQGIHLSDETLCIMVLTFVDYYDIESTVWDNGREIFKYAIINVLNEICKKHGLLYPVYNLPNEYLILFSRQVEVKPDILFREISDAVKQCFSLTCNCGYSEANSNKAKADTIYGEAKKACDFCFVTGSGTLVRYRDIEYRGEEYNFSSCIKDMRQAFSHNKNEQLLDVIPKLRVQSNSVSYKQINEIKELFDLYYLEMVRFIEDNSLPPKECQQIFIYDKLKGTSDLAELNKWLTESIKALAEALQNCSKISRAKQYIRQHYNEALTLGAVASQIGISEGYLSRLFQQSEGYGFSQFLIMTRIDVAKNLLTTTNLKIYEVAQQVGYPNVGQFNRMFKKVVGVSPKAFIK